MVQGDQEVRSLCQCRPLSKRRCVMFVSGEQNFNVRLLQGFLYRVCQFAVVAVFRSSAAPYGSRSCRRVAGIKGNSGSVQLLDGHNEDCKADNCPEYHTVSFSTA